MTIQAIQLPATASSRTSAPALVESTAACAMAAFTTHCPPAINAIGFGEKHVFLAEQDGNRSYSLDGVPRASLAATRPASRQSRLRESAPSSSPRVNTVLAPHTPGDLGLGRLLTGRKPTGPEAGTGRLRRAYPDARNALIARGYLPLVAGRLSRGAASLGWQQLSRARLDEMR